MRLSMSAAVIMWLVMAAIWSGATGEGLPEFVFRLAFTGILNLIVYAALTVVFNIRWIP